MNPVRQDRMAGRDAELGALIRAADDDAAAGYEGGVFLTLYLSPRHYHRIHAPCPGTIGQARHVPGALLPVHAPAVAHVPDLFPRNERLICYLDAAAGALGLCLGDEIGEHDRHPALHRLEGLARQPLVGDAQPAPERDHELRGDVGMLAHQAPHVAAENRDHDHVVERLDGRRAPLVVEHRQFAEDVPGPEVRQRDRAPVGMLAHGARVAAAHDVARVARVALAEDDLAGAETARDGDVLDAQQVLVAERLEHRDARQQLVGVVRSGRHRLRPI